jgi:hypothetical protein
MTISSGVTVMNETADSMVIKLPGDVVAEIETVRAGVDVEAFVHQAIHSYVESLLEEKLPQRLDRDYDELAAMYAELASDLADELWLPSENGALLQTEKDANS